MPSKSKLYLGLGHVQHFFVIALMTDTQVHAFDVGSCIRYSSCHAILYAAEIPAWRLPASAVKPCNADAFVHVQLHLVAEDAGVGGAVEEAGDDDFVSFLLLLPVNAHDKLAGTTRAGVLRLLYPHFKASAFRLARHWSSPHPSPCEASRKIWSGLGAYGNWQQMTSCTCKDLICHLLGGYGYRAPASAYQQLSIGHSCRPADAGACPSNPMQPLQ